MKNKNKIKIGNKVKDIVTGTVGIATARVEYLNGCIQFCLQPVIALQTIEVGHFYVDENQLEFVSDGVRPQMFGEKSTSDPHEGVRRPGGFMSNAPKY